VYISRGQALPRISGARHTVGPYISFRMPVPKDPPNKQKTLKDPSHDMSEADLSERIFSV
jgi:hypothetical protein